MRQITPLHTIVNFMQLKKGKHKRMRNNMLYFMTYLKVKYNLASNLKQYTISQNTVQRKVVSC